MKKKNAILVSLLDSGVTSQSGYGFTTGFTIGNKASAKRQRLFKALNMICRNAEEIVQSHRGTHGRAPREIGVQLKNASMPFKIA